MALQASQKSSNPSQARAYFLSALRTLQSGNRLPEALTMAEQNIGSRADDRETLFFVTRLARAAGRPDVADRYVRRLLRLSLLRQLEEVRLAAAHGGALPQKVSLRAGGPQLPRSRAAISRWSRSIARSRSATRSCRLHTH